MPPRVSDPRGKNFPEAGPPRLVIEFLRHSCADLTRLRALVPGLETGDAATWERACTLAHNIAAGANTHKLGVLTACARELDKLLCERTADEKPDEFLLRCIATAIEAVALEVGELMRER